MRPLAEFGGGATIFGLLVKFSLTFLTLQHSFKELVNKYKKYSFGLLIKIS